jgi:hypothetical protein
MAVDHGISIKEYHTNNGVHASKQLRSSCEASNQSLSFSGKGAKHQNGIMDRMIGTLTHHAQTMLLHATHLWPDIITEDLWPFALKLAVDLHNVTPIISSLSPDEIFSGTKCTRNQLLDFHPFGCPSFVL